MDLENIVIDIMQKNHTVIPSIQYDSNSRFITVKIITNGKPLDVSNHRVTVACRKPDGKLIFNDCTKVESKIGLVKFEITEQTGAEVGIVKSELRIYGAGNVCLTSQPFNIEITEPIIDAPVVTSSSEFKALTQAMSNLENMGDKFDKKYEEITNQFNNKFTELTNQFNDKSTELDNKFNDKFTLINQQFNDKSNALDQQFQEKFDNLENQYAVNLAGKVDKTDVSIEALPDKIVKRNNDGNIYVRHSIEFTTTGQEKHPLQVIDGAHVKIGNRQIWDDNNLPVDKGTFKPYGYGGGNSVQFTHSLQQGAYYKIGKRVTVIGRITAEAFNGATGGFQIGGLPFRITNLFPACSLGFCCGLKIGTGNMQITAYGENNSDFIKIATSNTNTGSVWSYVGVDKLINAVDISFTMTYLTD